MHTKNTTTKANSKPDNLLQGLMLMKREVEGDFPAPPSWRKRMLTWIHGIWKGVR